jgi:hypothetical protein
MMLSPAFLFAFMFQGRGVDGLGEVGIEGDYSRAMA